MAQQLVTWADNEEGELKPFLLDVRTGNVTQALWAAQVGSQVSALSCPVFEVLLEGNRGWGKTEVLLFDFLKDVGRGHGVEWRGILFRETFSQLSDIIAKSTKWFKQIYPAAKYNRSTHTWTFPGGEQLLLRYMKNADDYWNYHGHAYPWIGWEELCNWQDASCYKVMMSCCRSTKVGMRRAYRATTNPYGKGHNWVKSRFQLPQMAGRIIYGRDADGNEEPPRVAIHGTVLENKVLMQADPQYLQKLRASARNPAEAEAWVEGSWDITSGGMFDDLWDSRIHVVQRFPSRLIPAGWRITRSLDWGSSRPFSVGWWAESNGEPFIYENHVYGNVRGDKYRIGEWYGWTGEPNRGVRMLASQVGRGIIDREKDLGIAGRVKPGMADAAIYDYENGNCVASDLSAEGVDFLPADKSPGSRKQRWEQVREYLGGALPKKGIPREKPGLFVVDSCDQFMRLMPTTSRSDRDPDDVDTDTEDHLQDEVSYELRGIASSARSGGF